MTIGQRIKERRKDLKMTQQELADKIGYKTKSAISQVENDPYNNLTLDRVALFATALNCTSDYLMGWSVSSEPLSISASDKYLAEISKGSHPTVAEILKITQTMDEYFLEKLLDHAKKLQAMQNELED